MDEIRSSLSKGRWHNSRVFEDVVVATDMKIPTSKFWEWNEEDQAFTIALYRVKADMQGYEQFLHDRESSRNKNKNPKANKKPSPKRRR